MAEDLVDGEFWLPPEIFQDVGVERRRPDSGRVEPVNHQQAAFDLNHPLAGLEAAPNPSSEVFGPAHGFGAGLPTGGHFSGNMDAGLVPIYQTQRPLLAQEEGFRQERIGGYFGAPPGVAGPNRFLPGGVRRGTGVFLPQVPVNGRVNQKAGKTGGEQQKQSRTAVNNGKEAGMPPRASTEVRLPAEWPY